MECSECDRLFEALADVTKRHVHQIGRLQMATILHDQSTPALRKNVEDLQAAREQAARDFHTHERRCHFAGTLAA
jgi:hypothetical protein